MNKSSQTYLANKLYEICIASISHLLISSNLFYCSYESIEFLCEYFPLEYDASLRVFKIDFFF
jgi:hypothetical protein